MVKDYPAAFPGCSAARRACGVGALRSRGPACLLKRGPGAAERREECRTASGTRASITPLLHARQRGDQVAEAVAADFEIAVLVERRAGWRQQHHRLRYACVFRIARGVRNRNLQRLADLIADFALERRGEFLGRLADQIGFADAREIFGEAGDAAEFRLAAGDPENIRK